MCLCLPTFLPGHQLWENRNLVTCCGSFFQPFVFHMGETLLLGRDPVSISLPYSTLYPCGPWGTVPQTSTAYLWRRAQQASTTCVWCRGAGNEGKVFKSWIISATKVQPSSHFGRFSPGSQIASAVPNGTSLRVFPSRQQNMPFFNITLLQPWSSLCKS